MSGKSRRESQIISEGHSRAAALPILTDQLTQVQQYGAISSIPISDQDSLIQRRRASSMLSARARKLHLASSSVKNGQYQPIDTTISTEIEMMLKSSIPLIVTLLLQYSLTVSAVFFVGNLGSNELAAVSLSNLLANISSFGLIEGIASSLSTLCPQAYGRKEYKMVGLHSLRCFIMLMILFIPIYLFWTVGAYPLLSSVITEVEACKLAAKYLNILIWSVPGFITFEVLKQYLQAQGIFHASTVVLIICAPFNFILTYLLVWNKYIGIGFIGAPTAVAITNTIMALMLLFYSCFINGYQCWCGFSMEIFKNWSRALNLAGPGILMIEAEWLAFEIISFASSRFGTESLAAQSIVSTVCVTIYQIPFAVSIAGSTRIAWFIGSASKNAAIISTKAAIYLSVAFGTVNCIGLTLSASKIAYVFSKDLDVIKLAAKVLIIGAIYQIPDCMACVLGGILRGQGRQYIGGWLNLISYYVLSLPVAYVFGFTLNFKLFGLWIGMIVALVFVSSCELYFVITSNWDIIIKDSLVEDLDAEMIDSNNDNAIHDDTLSLRPSRSIGSLIDHNLLSPTISSPVIDPVDSSLHI
ncbi:hypothetical protein C6P40_001601 [Pichia californica]|uniref:Ethionine resistance-conferring protein 1 n=1 Tax=Pichia californica TaxID=460514 RepID=A0A9P6WKZ7_9ASCO|nr:hypothetical protein C6P42_000154 [[Candida] californica]KAG0687943.1 hypothetical protein C6P40_001601 [[Candida] californica]